mgnify:CR=1 FL=1
MYHPEKYTCDVCGKEVHKMNIINVTINQLPNEVHHRLMVCGDCWDNAKGKKALNIKTEMKISTGLS